MKSIRNILLVLLLMINLNVKASSSDLINLDWIDDVEDNKTRELIKSSFVAILDDAYNFRLGNTRKSILENIFNFKSDRLYIAKYHLLDEICDETDDRYRDFRWIDNTEYINGSVRELAMESLKETIHAVLTHNTTKIVDSIVKKFPEKRKEFINLDSLFMFKDDMKSTLGKAIEILNKEGADISTIFLEKIKCDVENNNYDLLGSFNTTILCYTQSFCNIRSYQYFYESRVLSFIHNDINLLMRKRDESSKERIIGLIDMLLEVTKI